MKEHAIVKWVQLEKSNRAGLNQSFMGFSICRVYGPEGGGRWPRLEMSVYRRSDRGEGTYFYIACAVKLHGRSWWHTLPGIPASLMKDAMDLFQEATDVESSFHSIRKAAKK